MKSEQSKSFNTFLQCVCFFIGPLTMGAIPVSPSDPIFYFHHANIDRFWALW